MVVKEKKTRTKIDIDTKDKNISINKLKKKITKCDKKTASSPPKLDEDIISINLKSKKKPIKKDNVSKEETETEPQETILSEAELHALFNDAKTQVKEVKEKTQNKIKNHEIDEKEERGVIVLSRIPRGFYENEMRGFFSQFGQVTRLRLSRNPKVCLCIIYIIEYIIIIILSNRRAHQDIMHLQNLNIKKQQ